MQKNKKADGKNKVDRVLPRAVCIVFGVFLLFLFSPAASFVFNEGSAVGMALGIVLLLIGVFFKPIVAFLRKVRQKKRGKIVLGVFCLIVLLVFLYSLVAGKMILSAAARAPAGEPDAVIVLGAQVKPEGEPSVDRSGISGGTSRRPLRFIGRAGRGRIGQRSAGDEDLARRTGNFSRSAVYRRKINQYRGESDLFRGDPQRGRDR